MLLPPLEKLSQYRFKRFTCFGKPIIVAAAGIFVSNENVFFHKTFQTIGKDVAGQP